MVTEEIKIKKIIASVGKILTKNGEYAIVRFLDKNDSPDNWTEITEAEYKEILKKQNEDNQNPNIEN